MGQQGARRIANNMFWLGVQEGLSRLIGFLLVMLLARMLSAESLGSLNICLALMTGLTILVRAGTGSRGTRLTARDPDNISRLHGDITGLRILVAGLLIGTLVAFSAPLAALLSVPHALLLLSTALLLRPALNVAWAFRGLDDMQPIALAAVGERLIVLVGVAMLLGESDLTAEPILLLELAGAAFLVLSLRWRLHRKLGAALSLRPNPSRWGSMLRESTPISLAAFAASIYRQGDLLLLGVLAGSGAAGLFLVPQKVVLTLLVLPVLIGTASFPAVSRTIHDDGTATVAMQARLLRLTLLLLLPACAGLAWYARELLSLLFGETYRGEAATLTVLLASAPFFAFATFQENLLLAIPKGRTVLLCRLLSVAGHLSVSILLIPRYGALGAAAGSLVSQALFAVAAAVAWQRAGGEPLLSRHAVTALAGILLALGVLHVADAALGPYGSAILAASAYIAALFAFGAVTPRDLRQSVAVLLPRGRDGDGR